MAGICLIYDQCQVPFGMYVRILFNPYKNPKWGGGGGGGGGAASSDLPLLIKVNLFCEQQKSVHSNIKQCEKEKYRNYTEKRFNIHLFSLLNLPF